MPIQTVSRKKSGWIQMASIVTFFELCSGLQSYEEQISHISAVLQWIIDLEWCITSHNQ